MQKHHISIDMDNTNNKEYWENYVTYWEEKVQEANQQKITGDTTLSDEVMISYVERLSLKEADVFLDFGCGSCRLYPYYKKLVQGSGKAYYGLDIAKTPLEHGKKMYPEIEEYQLKDFDGVRIPFKNETFDKIVCWGVFDACSQEKILAELLRVLKKDGKLLITGKNRNYYQDDELAKIAELNARKKGHPNYFTDVEKMKTQLEKKGFNIIEQYYFLYRGDFVKNIVKEKQPESFYEWLFIIQKVETKDVYFDKFSDMYSRIFG